MIFQNFSLNTIENDAKGIEIRCCRTTLIMYRYSNATQCVIFAYYHFPSAFVKYENIKNPDCIINRDLITLSGSDSYGMVERGRLRLNTIGSIV